MRTLHPIHGGTCPQIERGAPRMSGRGQAASAQCCCSGMQTLRPLALPALRHRARRRPGRQEGRRPEQRRRAHELRGEKNWADCDWKGPERRSKGGPRWRRHTLPAGDAARARRKRRGAGQA
eukprot:CAMPEP_0206163258 /NCGR_PEP_ID=MMETSP1474-20131121/11298_1 /ASSEMBLY_ACC=CAM_ASM_001110 /TAXON_ID=97495 /ORGANISM="Imantonia sp., Strain RCC918" /LENGTH=121 /DNA_ID=CAMNT_0053565711 /DNA_START=93 /DNA_END=458 /DNA_ORIENTATION=-